MTRRRPVLSLILVLTMLSVTPVRGEVSLSGPTIEAFDKYVQLSERQRAASPGFLWIESLPEKKRQAAFADLRKGITISEQLTTLEAGREIDIPDGMAHHWLGIVFVKGATLNSAVALLQDYDRHGTIYAPNVARSKLRSRTGDRFDFHLRFRMKKIITVVVNSEHRAQFTREGPDRVSSRIYSTRVAQVESPDQPDERELPVGRDDGYLWRLNSYWKFLEADGGVYIQTESISLTRPVPWYAYPVKSLITDLPLETLEFTLEKTRQHLAGRTGK